MEHFIVVWIDEELSKTTVSDIFVQNDEKILLSSPAYPCRLENTLQQTHALASTMIWKIQSYAKANCQGMTLNYRYARIPAYVRDGNRLLSRAWIRDRP